MRALACFVLLIASSASAAPPALDDLLKRLDASSAGTDTLAGEFTQISRVALFKQELKSTGRFFYRRPRQIRWEYLAPDPSTLVLVGDRATLSSPGAPPHAFDLKTDPTMRGIFDQLLLWFGSGSLQQARSEYDLEAGGTADAPSLTLKPKAGSPVAKAFKRIELRLDGKSLLLKSIAMVEESGDGKEVGFTKLQRNVALPADAFR